MSGIFYLYFQFFAEMEFRGVAIDLKFAKFGSLKVEKVKLLKNHVKA